MPKHINSASRLLLILQQASSIADQTQTLEAWAKLLGVEEEKSRRPLVVAERVQAAHRELRLMVEALEADNFTKNLYEGHVNRIEHALSILLLPATWNQVKQYVTADVLTALAFCAEILPDEESQISDQDIAEIRSRLAELRESLVDANLPARLRSLIQHHVELIEVALAEYPIAGAKVFRKAGREALGEIIEAKDSISPARDSPAVSKLEAMWKKVNEITDVALKGEKLAKLGQRAWDLLSGML